MLWYITIKYMYTPPHNLTCEGSYIYEESKSPWKYHGRYATTEINRMLRDTLKGSKKY